MDIVSERLRKLVQDTRAARDKVRELVAAKRWREAEDDPIRSSAYADRKAAKVAGMLPAGAEAIIGSADFMAASFLPEGAQIRRAVAFVEVNGVNSSAVGSGFLVSPSLFLTNFHVIGDENAARGTQIVFDREMDETGRPRRTTTYLLDPERFALFSPADQLDYALVAVGPLNGGSATLAELGFCALSDRGDKHVIGMNVNIVQHPRGLPKMLALRNNILQFRTERTLLYETDTEHGSSGAPVFNDDWDLIALHHWGEPFLERTDADGKPFAANVNEGIRISAIYRDLAARAATLSAPRQALLREALALDAQAVAAAAPARRLSPPPPQVKAAEALVVDTQGASMPSAPQTPAPATVPTEGELRFTLPLEVTIRMGQPAANLPAVSIMPASGPDKTLLRASEALRIDSDYGNRRGYDPAFIPGQKIGLPLLSAALAKNVAPLRAEETEAASGELKYEHFSIIMNKTKRMAIFTATNIDGATYLEVDRKTGQVSSEAAEAEKWFKDPRISASFFLDQTFYSEWSDFFDRGHLTRRSDPTWGDREAAQRANADTFHFTNATPQHFRFNQSAKFWQGAERFVLEKGVLAQDVGKPISVFQGPIFSDGIDMRADDVQIPSSFFKVIVWRGASALKSVGLVVDQLNLLSETRKSLGAPRDVASVDVSQWRVSIASIEKRTGLDFGAAVRGADTIAQGAQPNVGAEAQILVRSLDDLLPAVA